MSIPSANKTIHALGIHSHFLQILFKGPMGLVRMQVYCEVKAYTPYTAKNTETISSTNILLTRQKKKDHARSCVTFMVFVLVSIEVLAVFTEVLAVFTEVLAVFTEVLVSRVV